MFDGRDGIEDRQGDATAQADLLQKGIVVPEPVGHGLEVGGTDATPSMSIAMSVSTRSPPSVSKKGRLLRYRYGPGALTAAKSNRSLARSTAFPLSRVVTKTVRAFSASRTKARTVITFSFLMCVCDHFSHFP